MNVLKTHCLHCYEPIGKTYSQRKRKRCEACDKPFHVIQKNDNWYIQLDGNPLLPYEAQEIIKNIKNHEKSCAILEVLPIPPNCVSLLQPLAEMKSEAKMT